MPSAYLPSTHGFLGLSKEEAGHLDDAAVVVIPAGLDTSSPKDTAAGPQAIITASHRIEWFDEDLWREPHRTVGLATLRPFPLRDEISPALEQLDEVVESVLGAGKFPLILGGDSTLTAGAIRPFFRHDKKLTILHFCARTNLKENNEGEKFSPQSALRRCLDFPSIRLVTVGTRNISVSELQFLEDNEDRISIFWSKDKESWKLQQILDAVGTGTVYISFNLDSLDSALMPATATPEPGGLFWNETMEIIKAVGQQANVAGADIVGLVPREGTQSCDYLAAKLAFKILAYGLTQRRRSSP